MRDSSSPSSGLANFAWLVVATASISPAQPRTRAEQIELARRDKIARLWPERESPLVSQVNDLVERGLGEGLDSGKGANGWQVLFSGMRSGHGQTFGVGYRRSDLWHERLGYRVTARGTLQKASLFDFELDFAGLRSEHSFVNLYAKYENSPKMDFYGLGADSLETDRTSYRLEDFAVDMNAGFDLLRVFKVGITGGYLTVHTGAGTRGGFPSTDEVFGPETAPGLGQDTDFLRWGAFLQLDYRDRAGRPRSGGMYAARGRWYSDRGLGQFGFRQVELVGQQYVPYFNKTRVVALRVGAVLSFPDGGNEVPFYFKPKLGGNDDLRGFERFRFYDDHALFANVEHRWHASRWLDMALFVDVGKVVSRKSELDVTDLELSAGVGFRFKFQGAYVMRIDFAASREGFRWIWVMSDIFRLRWQL